MRNATNPVLEKLRSGLPNSGAVASVVNITVGANVDGNIVVGNNNFVYSVHNHYGTVVDRHTPSSVKKRKLKQQPPRLTPGFAGRVGELNQLSNHIKSREAVLIHGHDGIGKTALAGQAANSDPAKAMRDGVVYLKAVDETGQALGVQDTIQLIFDALYDANPPLKVTSGSARTYLSNTRPLVVLDRFEFSSTGLDTLAEMLPKGALAVTSRNAPGRDRLQHLRLSPLAREESIQLLANMSETGLDDVTRSICNQVCELLGDIPLAITETASIVRENRMTLAAALGRLQAIQPPSQGEPVQAAIERGYGLVYPVLDRDEREALAIAAAAPGISVDRAWLESIAGGERISRALESLELLQANSPRLGLADGLRPVIQNSRRDLRELRQAQLGHLLGQMRSRSLDFEFVSAELGNMLGLIHWAAEEKRWSDVITLGRAVDPYLTLKGLWDAWAVVLNLILEAARRLNDLSTQAWALHQLGSREIGVGSVKQAIHLLVRALQMRQDLGDRVGGAYTQHNLDLILPPEPPRDTNENPPSAYPPSRRWPGGWIFASLVAVAAVIALLLGLWPGIWPPRPQGGCPMPDGWQVYRVQRQDTMDSITRRTAIALYNEFNEKQLAVTKLAIADANCLSLPAEVSGGQRLNLPVVPVSRTLEPTAIPVVAPAATAEESSGQSFGNGPIRAPSRLSLEISGKTEAADTFHLLGEVINYSYVIVNTGSQPLEGAVSVRVNRGDVTCPEINFLGPEESVNCTGTYHISQADLDYGSVTSSASARVGDIESDESSSTIYAVQNPGLAFSKVADPTTYDHAGQVITYTYTISNNGNVTLSPVKFKVSDDHIAGNKQFDCGPEITELAPDTILTCTASYTITDADVEAGSVTNRAYGVAYGVLRLRRQLITTSPATTTIHYAVPVTLTKTADLEKYDRAGQTITYTYTITNINDVSLPGPVAVSDNRAIVAPCPELESLAPHETLVCTGTYVVTQADLDYGSVTNTALARVGRTVSKEAALTVPADQRTELEISSTANPTTYESASQTITYTYVITNKGNVTLDPTRFVLRKEPIQRDTPIACDPQKKSLAPTETINCTATYTITEADVDTGSVTNQVTVSIEDITSQPAISTVTYICPPPPAGWAAYIIRPGVSLSEISSWYANTSIRDLQRANCMSLSTAIISGNRLYVPYLASIRGIVFADPNRDGIRQDDEPLLSGFTVPISSSERNVNRQTQTDANGIYLFTGLPPGTYQVLYFWEDLTSRDTRERNFGVRPVP